MTTLSTAIRASSYFETELDEELQAQGKLRNVGVCFSGGGSRALSATMGQLRGLSQPPGPGQKPWIDRIGTISSVSGGCWASSLYTYLPDKFSYSNFLNSPAGPSELTWSGGASPSNLAYLPPDNMGWVPTRIGWEELYDQVEYFRKQGFNDSHQWWRAAIGNLIFRDFDLYSPDKFQPTKYFGWQEFYFDRVTKPYNPLTAGDLRFSRNYWPWLIMNAGMFYPDFSGKQELVPFFSSMQQGGILGTFPQHGQSGPVVGGGTVQPFALGSQFQAKQSDGRVKVSQSRPFSLVDMAAMSSSAFAAEFENKYGLDDLVPEYTYWSPINGGSVGQTYQFADGGNIENSGLVTLIANTQLKKIVVFVNSSEAVEHDLTTFEYTQVPATIPPLFGYQPIGGILDSSGYKLYKGDPDPRQPLSRYNQVFPSDRFHELLDGLKNAINGRRDSAIFFQKSLPVKLNSWFGISKEQVRNVDVLWVCNNKVSSWEDQITDPKIKQELSLRDIPDTGLWNFPYYSTLEQLNLTPRQVNMLAHLSCWNVTAKQNRSEWLKIFD